jgi:hypothetical protein
LNSEMIWKIQKKIVKRYEKYGRKVGWIVKLSFCPFSFGYRIVCPFSLGYCIVCPFSFGHCIVCPFSLGHCINQTKKDQKTIQ